MLVQIGTVWLDADRVYTAELSDEHLTIRSYIGQNSEVRSVVIVKDLQDAERIMSRINQARSQ